MNRLVLAASIVAAATASAPAGLAPATAPAPAAVAAAGPLLGMVGEVPPLRLARVDPQTLRARAGVRIETGGGGCASRDGGEACWSIPPWAYSPDRSLLAIARNDRFQVRSLRVVDVRKLPVVADVKLSGDPLGAVAWLGSKRIVAVQEVCCGRQRLVAVDVATKRVRVQPRLPGAVFSVVRAGRRLVLVLAPGRAIGVATLALADATGAVRTVRLDRIAAGTRTDTSGSFETTRRVPALAVDPSGGRAYVVGEQLVADVDLRTLAVAYHALQPRSSFLGRLWAWLEPTAQAKGVSGTTRVARWLGNGILAVSGAAEQTVVDSERNEQTHVQPFGLRFVDTRTWSVRIVDRDATSFDAAGNLLLATGWSTDTTPLGLAVYAFDGTQRFHLFGGERVWVELAYGGRAYVGVSRNDGVQEPLRIVDLARGTGVGARREPLPWLLLGSAGGWWVSPS